MGGISRLEAPPKSRPSRGLHLAKTVRLGALSLFFCAAPSFAAPPAVKVGVGKTKVLVQFPHVDDRDCKLKPHGTIHVETPPEHGKVVVKHVQATAEHNRCGKVKGEVIRVVYTPNPGYQGPDSVEVVQVIEPSESSNGGRVVRRYRVPIEVK